MRRIYLLVLAAGFAAGEASAQQPSCLLPSQRPMIVAELFFGRDIRGRAPVSEKEWAQFAARVIARQFPDGFTVHDGSGEWLDHHGRIVRERTKILTIASAPTANLNNRLQAVMDIYKKQFRQISVGILTTGACGAF